MSGEINSWTLCVDYRESSLIEELKKISQPFSIENLILGDIVYKSNGIPVCLIERKTIDDYVASISDGRLKNQSIRIKSMKDDNPNLSIIYLIEGKMPKNAGSQETKYRCNITSTALYSSLIGKILRDNFSLYFTGDVAESAFVVKKVLDKLMDLSKKGELSINNMVGTGISNEKDYADTIKLEKKANMTPKMYFTCQLAQIPGMSTNLAEIIFGEYKNMRSIISAYDKLGNVKDRLKLMTKFDGIGKILSERIYEYVYQEEEQLVIEKPKLVIKLK